MHPSTLDESGLESAYDDCVGKVKLHGWWVGVMYVLIIPDESFLAIGETTMIPVMRRSSERAARSCAPILVFQPFHFVSPKLVSRDALPLPTFYSCSLPQVPPNLLPPFPMSHRLLKLIVRCNRPFGRESSHPHSL